MIMYLSNYFVANTRQSYGYACVLPARLWRAPRSSTRIMHWMVCYKAKLLQYQARLAILILTVMVTTIACQNNNGALVIIALCPFTTKILCIIQVEQIF